MTAALFGLGAAAAGVTQAWLLARSVSRRAQAPLLLIRLLLVAAVLVGAAIAGQLVPGALGWVSGYGVAVVALYRRYR